MIVARQALPVVWALLAALSLSACSGFLAEAAVRRPPVEPGTPRAEVLAVLGPPRRSVPISPPRLGGLLAGAPAALRASRVGLFDEYSVSGLVQLTGDPYRYEWNIYPAAVILTGGAVEAVVLPLTSADLARRSLVRYRLRFWYDPRERLLAYDRP